MGAEAAVCMDAGAAVRREPEDAEHTACPVCGLPMLRGPPGTSKKARAKAFNALRVHLFHSWKRRGIETHSPCGPALRAWALRTLPRATHGIGPATASGPEETAVPALVPSRVCLTKTMTRLQCDRAAATASCAAARTRAARELLKRLEFPQAAVKQAASSGILPWLNP